MQDEAYIPKAYPPLEPIIKRDYTAEVNKRIASDYIDPDEDELEFTFGKYRGLFPSQVLKKDPGYIVWVHDNVDKNKWFFPEKYYKLAKGNMK